MTNQPHSPDDQKWMQLAMEQARRAEALGEVPVGAVVVRSHEVVATGHNQTRSWNDPTAHAEVVALREAARTMGNHRLADCDLYVTLEPCLMCSGAILHARLRRVIYGASDPKAGASGSVIDAFAIRQINHQTQVVGGLLAEEGGALLQRFFAQRRGNPQPLREDALRTPEVCFERLGIAQYTGCYVSDLPSLNGLRMHYLDERRVATPLGPAVTWLALHPLEDWSYRFHAVIPGLVEQGHRVLAPDLIGFGRSDKPKRESQHTKAWHHQVLREWLAKVEARNLALLFPSDGHGLGQMLQISDPGLFLPTASAPLPPVVPPMRIEAQNAPFPDKGHLAGPRALKRWI